MSTIARHLRLPVCLAGFLFALPLLTVAPELLERSGCDRIPLWVKSHQTHLPLTYDELLAYPKDFRARIFSALPGSNRASIMVAHLRWFETSERSLTADQRQFLDHELMPFVAPGTPFDERVSSEQRQHIVKPIESKMKLLFSNDLAKRAVGAFDEPVVFPKSITALRIRLAEAIRESVTVSASGDCQCSTVSNYCGGGLACGQSGLCEQTGPGIFGCGYLLLYICDGNCCYPNDWGCGSDLDCCSLWCPRELYLCNGGGSPILINMRSNSTGDHLTSAADGVEFDLRADGHAEVVAWTRPDAPIAFLALDRNGNGTIDNGRELFGNFTLKADGTRATNGFEALKSFDENHDGKIDATDAIFGQLRLWFDRNHDGRSESAELMTLSEAGVDAIYTDYTVSSRTDRHGNEYRFAGTAVLDRHNKDTERRIFDVFLTTVQ